MVCDMWGLWLRLSLLSLNPYSIGIWSATLFNAKLKLNRELVLIYWNMVCDKLKQTKGGKKHCLNPYSIGIWSATTSHNTEVHRNISVLILILLEYGLRLTGVRPTGANAYLS